MTTDCTHTHKANEDCFDCQWSNSCRLLGRQPRCSSKIEGMAGFCLFYDKQTECDTDDNCIVRQDCLYIMDIG